MVVTKEVTRGVFDPRTYREDDPANWARKRRSDWLAVPGKIHFVRWRDLYFMILYFKCLTLERELLTRTLLMMERRLHVDVCLFFQGLSSIYSILSPN